VQQLLEADGESAQRLIDRYLSLIRKSLPTDLGLVYAMHLCRGNYQGRWLSEGSYAPIAERLFNELPIDVFLLEYDTERAGDFAPLRHLPAGKRALLGLVSTKTADLESPDELRRRIDEAARHTDIDRLGICPQCGFASTVGGNPVTEDDERRKLELIVEVANQVWGSL
jgi:5-methyltetrahydropteroyltriglutamate--homocysteine methyltransferase